MKNECDIVKDLLFSYNDGVLSETSNEFVEEHLKNCESCKKALEEIRQESKDIEQKKEIDAFKGVRKKLTKKNIIISISLIILLIIIIFNILVFKNYNEVASTMVVYLEEDITNEQLENIEEKITQNVENIEITYVSKEQELEEVKTWLGENTNVLDVYNNSENNPLLANLEIKANTNKEIQEVVEAIQGMPGIRSISSYINWNPYELFMVEKFLD